MQENEAFLPQSEYYGEFDLALDDALRIRRVNEAYTRLTGYDMEDAACGNHTLEQLISAADFPDMKARVLKVLGNGEIQTAEFRILTKSNKEKAVFTVLSLHREAGKLSSVRCLMLDAVMLSARLRSENPEVRAERRQVPSESDQEVYFEYDANTGDLVMPDRKGENGEIPVLSDYTRRIMESDTIFPADRSRVYELFTGAKPSPELRRADFRTRFFTGDYEWYRVTLMALADAAGGVERIVGKFHSIRKEKEMERMLLEHATSDKLTGFFNASGMMLLTNRFFRSLREESCHALLLVEIVRWKEIRAQMGSLYADTVVEKVSDALREIFTEEPIFGRTEDDLFAVLMKHTNPKAVGEHARQACDNLQRCFDKEDISIPETSVRIGISFYPFHGQDYGTLYHKASLARYRLGEEKTGYRLFCACEGQMEKVTEEEQKGKGAEPEGLPDTKFARERPAIRNSGFYDTELVSFAFELASSGSDLETALEVLFPRIGRQYRLSGIAVLESRSGRHVLFRSHVWSAEESEARFRQTYDYDVVQSFLDKGEEGGIRILSHPEGFAVHPSVLCGWYRGRKLEGCILFSDGKEARDWSETESATFREITKILSYFLRVRKENALAAGRIEKLSNYDRVTGLYNMERFKEEVGRLLQENGGSHTYALVYCDLSNFAYINESYGYEKGDELLHSFARLAAGENENCLVASRIFSDCFTLCLEYESKAELLNRVISIAERFEREQKANYPNADIHVVTGIYLWEEGTSVAEAIDNANLARKSIKGNRKAICQIYRPEMKDRGKKEFIALATLQNAMTSHQLEVYLQPKVSLETKKVNGAEALIRWRNEDGTMKYPDEFIPALERNGSIVDLDFYVYEQVLIRMRMWLDEGRQVFPVSVNLSRMHIYYGDFVERLLDLTLQYRIPNELIEFEVTESAFIQDSENLISRLGILRNAGFRLSIDDFGVGYSSLSMLVDAPVDIVKIDKSFLYHYEKEPERRNLIRYLIEMAHTMHKEIIFEGVETVEQAEFLTDCGCETVQGYLFSKPIPIPEFEHCYMDGGCRLPKWERLVSDGD